MGINIREDFELSNDIDDIDYTFNSVKRATIAPTLAPGKYALFARTFYDRTEESDDERVAIEVKQCNLPIVQPQNLRQNDVDDSQGTNNQNQNVDLGNENRDVDANVDGVVDGSVGNNNGGIESIENPSIFDNKKIVMLMIILIIIIALLIILGLYYVML